ncbi:hypothetical protein HQ585_14985 [candidate division KSB1 bacterium]|nr:hypothetical protein [candidate division KSB1 bacterium]
MAGLIEKAKSAIGDDKINDYIIAPTDFPDTLYENAPELSKILRHSSFQEKAGRYEQHDTAAISSQSKFKSYAHQSTWAIGIAAISGSFLAGLSLINLDPILQKSVLLFLGFISMIGGGLAIFRLYQIRNQKLLERWMSARAKAETERLGYFNSLSKTLITNNKTDVYLHLLFLCMFKRYQIDVQRLYYTKRGEDHRKSLGKTSTIGAIAALCLALGSGVLGMIGAFLKDLLPLAALGTIGAAVSVVASRREELNQDERNSERYSRTADILSKITEKHDDVLTIVNKGNNPDIIIEYVDAVNDQLSLEHRQWTSDVSEMSSALNALEKSLSEMQKE